MKSSKRQFIKQISLGLLSTQIPFLSNAKNLFFEDMGEKLKLSLAQWSLHNAFESGTLDPILFSEISKKEFGIP